MEKYRTAAAKIIHLFNVYGVELSDDEYCDLDVAISHIIKETVEEVIP